MVSNGISGDRLNRKEAAAYLSKMGYPVAPRTLARLATMRKGPPYVRFMHRTVLYEKAVLEAWAKSQMTEVATGK
jgi:hypothetical protein